MGKIFDITARTRGRAALAVAISAALYSVSMTAWAQQNVGSSSGGASTVFATGNFVLPEGITAAPSSFGGGYLVSDPLTQTIYQISASGGPATVFSQTSGFNGYAGTALSSYYNGTALAGQYLEVGSDGSMTGLVDTISASGTATNVITISNPQFVGVATAPSNYGTISSGQVLLAGEPTNYGEGTGEIYALNQNGTLSAFAAIPAAATISPAYSSSGVFALGFAPSGFGQYGGDLFADDAASGNLYVVNAQGQSTLFADITLPAGATGPGLRQFAWAPAGFGQYGGDLFVSVAATNGGGGELGEIEVFNASGQEIALYDQGSAANPLDPRGLLFATIDGQTQLLAVNADPEIDVITAAAFTATAAPEIDAKSAASALTLLLGGLAVLAGARRRRPGGSQTA